LIAHPAAVDTDGTHVQEYNFLGYKNSFNAHGQNPHTIFPRRCYRCKAAMKAAASEPAEGATTLKKKAQEKLAAKANPVLEVSEPEAVAEVAEVPAEDVTPEVVSEVVETPAEEAAAE
jgi:hypothetical protein